MSHPYDESVHKRLLSKLEQDPYGDCLIWQGTKNEKGYGRIRIEGKLLFAHRVALEFKLNRRLETGEVCMHECDVPECCNPDHLTLGSLLENNRQIVERKRHRTGKRKKRRPNLTLEEVALCRYLLSLNLSVSSVASRLEVGESTVRDVRSGRTHRGEGYASEKRKEG